MDAFREEMMLRLARDLAISHGTFFAAALLAGMGVPLPKALEALTGQILPLKAERRKVGLLDAKTSSGKPKVRRINPLTAPNAKL